MQLNAPPKPMGKSSDLAGIPLVITQVKGWQHLDSTSLGKPADALVIDIMVVEHGDPIGFPGDDNFDAEGPLELHAITDVLIFWSGVQRQLENSHFRPPVAGKFEKVGNSYALLPLDEEEMSVVQGLLETP